MVVCHPDKISLTTPVSAPDIAMLARLGDDVACLPIERMPAPISSTNFSHKCDILEFIKSGW
jgi:hypothetical protein